MGLLKTKQKRASYSLADLACSGTWNLDFTPLDLLAITYNLEIKYYEL